MRCEDVMTPCLISIGPDETVSEARQTMKTNQVHALPVVSSGGKPLGMLTATDLLKDVEPTIPVSRLMTPHMISVPKSRDVGAAARMMRDYKFHHVVVTDGGKLAGMLSALDLVSVLADSDDSRRRAGSATRKKRAPAAPRRGDGAPRRAGS